MVMAGGWCKWHSFTHISLIPLQQPGRSLDHFMVRSVAGLTDNSEKD